MGHPWCISCAWLKLTTEIQWMGQGNKEMDGQCLIQCWETQKVIYSHAKSITRSIFKNYHRYFSQVFHLRSGQSTHEKGNATYGRQSRFAELMVGCHRGGGIILAGLPMSWTHRLLESTNAAVFAVSLHQLAIIITLATVIQYKSEASRWMGDQ